MIVIALVGAIVFVLLIAGIVAGKQGFRASEAGRHFSDASDHLDKKEYAAAEKDAREAIRLNPHDASYAELLGDIFYAQDKYKDAVTAYRSAIRLEPTNAEFHNKVANSLYGDDKRADSIPEYREAARLDTAEAAYPGNLGRMLAEERQYPEAETALREAIPSQSGRGGIPLPDLPGRSSIRSSPRNRIRRSRR